MKDGPNGSGLVTVESADLMPYGWKHWLTSDTISTQWRGEQGSEEMLRVDAGRNLGLTRLVARTKPEDQSRRHSRA